MFSRSSWLHLRIPFSVFLLPIFLFALSVSDNLTGERVFWSFFIIHFLLYPASNGYNSYFDKDTKSIGGLKHPPPVKRGLYSLALLLDSAAIVVGYLKINTSFAAMLLVYGLVSKAYSHPAIRLKKYAWTSWIVTGLFQGLFTFMMSYVGVNDYTFNQSLSPNVVIPGLLTSLMLWANYPLTQVYQHEEDRLRGDITLSIRLGIPGTFYFAASCFTAAIGGFLFYLKYVYAERYAWYFLLALIPVLAYFIYWFALSLKDRTAANHTRTMRFNYLSGFLLNGYFLFLFLESRA